MTLEFFFKTFFNTHVMQSEDNLNLLEGILNATPNTQDDIKHLLTFGVVNKCLLDALNYCKGILNPLPTDEQLEYEHNNGDLD